MIVVLIVVGYFAVVALIGTGLALVTGDFRKNIGGILAAFMGPPAVIAVFGIALGLVAALFKFLSG